ncbi:MAG: hypothetical protein HY619_05405 [Thaumarchaeota archaeon]|nr:hypothetical protein [Nitrososphaerota archaeon]
MEVAGWILDVYPGFEEEMVVWIKKADGETVRLTDSWHNAIYVSADHKYDLEWLLEKKHIQSYIHSAYFVKKREHVFDYEEREVLKLVLRRAGEAEQLAKTVERSAEFGYYRIYNADLLPAQAYFIEKDLFPLAKVIAEKVGDVIRWKILDSVKEEDYELPPLRKVTLRVEVDGKPIPKFTDPIKSITVFHDDNTVVIKDGVESEKIFKLVDTVRELDPDLLLIEKGDEFTTHYLAERAYANNILDKLILSRDPVPLRRLEKKGTSYFAYGRILHTPASHKLYGRINLDARRHFVFEQSGLYGLFEVARLCRMPLHKGSRASIGKCLSGLQFYIACKDNLLIPWKPTRAEVFKTAATLLIGDRGGFIFEPRVGVHEHVGELDFASLYPAIMVKYNISAETVLCKCCRASGRRVPDVDYNTCIKREGIIPRSLGLILEKREDYKKKRNLTDNPDLKRRYAERVDALKGILVCSFGYLSYRNAKFGLIDCHIAVCAYARQILLAASKIAERRGFEVVHGIVDSIWVKKPKAKIEDFKALAEEIEQEIGLPISFEGIYRWIAFLPSRMHEDVPVLNRYFGVFEDGTLKIRGIETRRRDTVKLVEDCQNEILNLLSSMDTADAVRDCMPNVLQILDSYAESVRSGKLPVTDLIVTTKLTKNFNEYVSSLPQVAAIRQLAEEGLELRAGQSVSYIITKFASNDPKEKVRPIQLVDSSIRYDRDRYIELLVRGVSTILQPFGYDEEKLLDLVNRTRDGDLAMNRLNT